MNPVLAEKIRRARKSIADDPDGILAGEIRSPSQRANDQSIDGWDSYREFLGTADGATFGLVDLWSSSELKSKQYVADDLPNGSDNWLVIGQINYEPLAMERLSGQLRMFPRDGNPSGEPLGPFDEFLLKVLGDGYREFAPDVDDDEWWQLLQVAGLR